MNGRPGSPLMSIKMCSLNKLVTHMTCKFNGFNVRRVTLEIKSCGCTLCNYKNLGAEIVRICSFKRSFVGAISISEKMWVQLHPLHPHLQGPCYVVCTYARVGSMFKMALMALAHILMLHDMVQSLELSGWLTVPASKANVSSTKHIVHATIFSNDQFSWCVYQPRTKPLILTTFFFIKAYVSLTFIL